MEQVGAYEAKTHLPQLLDRVARGERITITRRGVPIAVLSPPPTEDGDADVRAAVEEMFAIRKGRTTGGLSVRELIEEGRRF